MKKKTKKLVLAKETLRELVPIPDRKINGALTILLCGDDTRSVYWSCVCTPSGMYTCEC